MPKTLDWSLTYKTPLRGKRGSYASRQEQIQKSYERLKEQEQAQANFAQLEPLLRKSLLEAMVNREPIMVLKPINYLTEGLKKAASQNEIDAAFYNQRGNSDEAAAKTSFEIQHQQIMPGTELTFSHIDNQLGKWIFKSSTGGEVELYGTPTVQVPGRAGIPQEVRNDGFWGLLMNTNIYQDLVSGLGSEEESEPNNE